MKQGDVKKFSLIAIAVIIISSVLVAGCITSTPVEKKIVVLDRVMTEGFGTGPCWCVVSTTDGEAFRVGSDINCAKLKPGINATVILDSSRDCQIRDVVIK
jgi:hypothetical protein